MLIPIHNDVNRWWFIRAMKLYLPFMLFEIEKTLITNAIEECLMAIYLHMR